MASRLTLQYRRFQMSWFLKCLLLLLVQFDVLNSFKFSFLRSKYLSHLVPNANLDTIQNNEQSHALQQLIMRFNFSKILYKIHFFDFFSGCVVSDESLNIIPWKYFYSR